MTRACPRLVWAEVDIEVPLVVSVNGPGKRWPRPLEREYTLHFTTEQLLACLRVEHGRLARTERQEARAAMDSRAQRKRYKSICAGKEERGSGCSSDGTMGKGQGGVAEKGCAETKVALHYGGKDRESSRFRLHSCCEVEQITVLARGVSKGRNTSSRAQNQHLEYEVDFSATSRQLENYVD